MGDRERSKDMTSVDRGEASFCARLSVQVTPAQPYKSFCARFCVQDVHAGFNELLCKCVCASSICKCSKWSLCARFLCKFVCARSPWKCPCASSRCKVSAEPLYASVVQVLDASFFALRKCLYASLLVQALDASASCNCLCASSVWKFLRFAVGYCCTKTNKHDRLSSCLSWSGPGLTLLPLTSKSGCNPRDNFQAHFTTRCAQKQ